MAETIDEATIIAWVDGELDEAQAARVAQAIVADPGLAALADRHRRMKARFAAAFGPIADEAVPMPAAAPVISLAAVRAERDASAAARPPQRWWGVGSAIAASLLVGVLVGHGIAGSSDIADTPQSLALAAPIAAALDGQLSGDAGTVRVALSFKDRGGHYCRGFSGQSLSGVACRDAGGWQLRYAAPALAQGIDYRMAGTDPAQAQLIASMIDGDPLDRTEEAAARGRGWR